MTASLNKYSFLKALELLLKRKLEFSYIAFHFPLSCVHRAPSGIQGF